MNWRSIETAPRDGTRILLTDGFAVHEGQFDYVSPEDDDGEGPLELGLEWWWRADGDEFPVEATHWMPLPAPPFRLVGGS